MKTDTTLNTEALQGRDTPGKEGAGKVALVTGAAQGIGRGIAGELIRRGYLVHAAYHSESKAESTEELVGKGRAHQAELTRAEEAQRLVGAVIERSGRLDVLVHAVGPYLTRPLSETKPADHEAMLQGNLFTAIHMIDAARSPLRESHGAYLFFGCAGLERWRARQVTAAYIASKAALLVTMRALSIEEAEFGVRANMISPGFVPHDGAAEDTLSDDLHKKIPIGRPAEMGEVTEAAAFLVSQAASHIVGQNLEVAGGWML
ncbi:3-oxoacyl-[acyl-carrier-protein] reductase FabG [Planctomycetes bacterium Poly30]|uniref:3-oxoacyl-[acyl-carrier-protein] reductase FabG n=1 Tax=Saltatorellus ferox TaxID=2528018 RepID=A0A518ESB7_9BACT|nr:3-oxoacyl-[acyl-carrier-protein] reductase FabG [Planctomycetes bacterium Poly30]